MLSLRFLAAVVRALTNKRRLRVEDDSALVFRVWPTDLDFNRHLNNARYLALMDIGRLDLLSDVGLLRLLLRLRWSPVVGAAMLRFRKPLDPWMRFTLNTRMIGWDEKWFYIEQRFERDGELYAYGLVRALFRSDGRSLSPVDVLEALGAPPSSPALPEVAIRWREALEAGRVSAAA